MPVRKAKTVYGLFQGSALIRAYESERLAGDDLLLIREVMDAGGSNLDTVELRDFPLILEDDPSGQPVTGKVKRRRRSSKASPTTEREVQDAAAQSPQ